MKLAAKALAVAETQIGVTEKGNNRGKEVEAYLKSVGLPGGYAWCMAFVYWCYQQVADKYNVPNPLVRTAGVLSQWQHNWEGKKLKRSEIIDPSVVNPGTVFIIDHGGGKGHTGLVEKIEDGLVYTIEGNTNEEGSREGIAVMRRVRPLHSMKGFIAGL